jgi:uncharacterized membrane protein YkoI
MMQSDSQQNANSNQKKKSILKITIITSLIVLVIVITITAFFLWPGNVSRQEATNIAIAHVGGGNANWPEMEFEHFQRVWSVEVFYDGLEHEVFINRLTGEIIRVEIDGWR